MGGKRWWDTAPDDTDIYKMLRNITQVHTDLRFSEDYLPNDEVFEGVARGRE